MKTVVSISKFAPCGNYPVITIVNNDYAKVSVEINEDGDINRIYRTYRFDPQLKDGEPKEITISEQTVNYLSDFEKTFGNGVPILMKLEVIQRYLTGGDVSAIENFPIHSIEINDGLYHAAKKVIELRKFLSDEFRTNNDLRKRNKEQEREIKLLRAQIKAGTTDKEAVALVLGGKKLSSKLTQLFNDKEIHPNSYKGKGRWASIGTDWASQIESILNMVGIEFESGNDAPRGGFYGKFIKLK